MSNQRKGRTTDAQLRRLKRLSPETRIAVKNAVIDWVETARAEGYAPMDGWANFLVEADHSALLARVLSGKRPFPERPPLRYAYPDYDAMEQEPT